METGHQPHRGPGLYTADGGAWRQDTNPTGDLDSIQQMVGHGDRTPTPQGTWTLYSRWWDMETGHQPHRGPGLYTAETGHQPHRGPGHYTAETGHQPHRGPGLYTADRWWDMETGHQPHRGPGLYTAETGHQPHRGPGLYTADRWWDMETGHQPHRGPGLYTAETGHQPHRGPGLYIAETGHQPHRGPGLYTAETGHQPHRGPGLTLYSRDRWWDLETGHQPHRGPGLTLYSRDMTPTPQGIWTLYSRQMVGCGDRTQTPQGTWTHIVQQRQDTNPTGDLDSHCKAETDGGMRRLQILSCTLCHLSQQGARPSLGSAAARLLGTETQQHTCKPLGCTTGHSVSKSAWEESWGGGWRGRGMSCKHSLESSLSSFSALTQTPLYRLSAIFLGKV